MNEHWTEEDEQRMDVIGSNGNDGDHYAAVLGFTPGPWEYDDCDCDGDIYVGTPYVDSRRVAQGVRREDKPLIAAAPELYAALECLVRDVQMVMGDVGQELELAPAINAAHKTLAKARGG